MSWVVWLNGLQKKQRIYGKPKKFKKYCVNGYEDNTKKQYWVNSLNELQHVAPASFTAMRIGDTIFFVGTKAFISGLPAQSNFNLYINKQIHLISVSCIDSQIWFRLIFQINPTL